VADVGDFLGIVQEMFEKSATLDDIFSTGKALRNIVDDMERSEVLFRKMEYDRQRGKEA
jgi:hypothetical protein